ncbi:hypothetical protein ACLVWU_11320 [Bdellovibrio sp. HCB290]|uniref:hypothetical protein n=1 Tax=Bdellovibrio sp. HCB290 TaxID=3394356 RepID=UPI0039B5EB37
MFWTAGTLAAPIKTATPPPQETDLETDLIQGNINISSWFDSFATGLDLFLAGQRYTTNQNKTTAVIEVGAYLNSFDGLKNDLAFDFNLRLPNVEEYWQVTFTSYDETSERGVAQNYVRNTPRERNPGATFGFFRQLGNVRTSFQPRISFAGTPKLSHTLTFESIAERRKSYHINPKLQFYADAEKGTGTFQAINFNFYLGRNFNLTLVNEGDYIDREHLYTVTNGVALGQWFTKKESISYNIFFTSKNREVYHLASYNLSVAFVQILYENILDYQIQPNIDFSEEHDFVRNPGLNFHLYLRF